MSLVGDTTSKPPLPSAWSEREVVVAGQAVELVGLDAAEVHPEAALVGGLVVDEQVAGDGVLLERQVVVVQAAADDEGVVAGRGLVAAALDDVVALRPVDEV